MKMKKNVKPYWLSAQSASELAIFGAIVMFVIASLIKTGMSMSQRTNTQLRAFRLALLESYRTSEGAYGDIIAARNSASVLILEDRLSVDPGSKQGTSDRIPFMASGSGTFSKNMLYPKDLGERSNYPFYDVFINGQRFPFIMADFIKVQIRSTNEDGATIQRAREGRQNISPEENETAEYETIELPNCKDVTPRACWNAEGGFAVFMKKNYNYLANEQWCWSGDCGGNLPADWRFDLDLDGDLDDIGSGYVPADTSLYEGSKTLREKFMWQWVAVGTFSLDDADIDKKVVFSNGVTATNILPIQEGDRLDIDGDFQDEAVHAFAPVNFANKTVGFDITVLDSQEGELDFSWDGRNDALLEEQKAWWDSNCEKPPKDLNCTEFRPTKPKVGLESDVRMYSFTKKGTYLQLQEGKLVDPSTGQAVRSTTKRDHVDIIERVFYLSNDTERFCDQAGNRRDWRKDSTWAKSNGVQGLSNPVEACNNCFSEGNVRNTCFDQESKILFIRSRLDDIRGRKWQTILK